MYQLCIKFFVNYYYFSLLLIFNQNKMKKLTYLFLALIIVACSDDDSDGNQLFLEKYDSIVWESTEDKIDNERIAFVNSSKTLAIFYDACFIYDLEERYAILCFILNRNCNCITVWCFSRTL